MTGKQIRKKNLGKIRIAKGPSKKVAAHPDAETKADALMEQWALASSQESLPRVIIDELQKSEQIHWHRIDSATKEIDNSDNPITEWEIMNALKRGKSTAPGDDGVTYDIINALAEVRGNPLYF